MQPLPESEAREPVGATVLELVVDNHAGTMSHICGMFSRRAFNLEGILCVPVGDGENARMWLRVFERERLAQVVAQLAKLEEVLSVHPSPDGDRIFGHLQELASVVPES